MIRNATESLRETPRARRGKTGSFTPPLEPADALQVQRRASPHTKDDARRSPPAVSAPKKKKKIIPPPTSRCGSKGSVINQSELLTDSGFYDNGHPLSRRLGPRVRPVPMQARRRACHPPGTSRASSPAFSEPKVVRIEWLPRNSAWRQLKKKLSAPT